MQVEFTCTELPGIDNYAESGRSRYGLITTSNSTVGTESGVHGRSTAGYPIKEISGDVYLNGGDLTTNLADIGLRALSGSSYASVPPATATPSSARYLVPGVPTVPPALPAVPVAAACDPAALNAAFPDYLAVDGTTVTQAAANCDLDPGTPSPEMSGIRPPGCASIRFCRSCRRSCARRPRTTSRTAARCCTPVATPTPSCSTERPARGSSTSHRACTTSRTPCRSATVPRSSVARASTPTAASTRTLPSTASASGRPRTTRSPVTA